MGREAILVVNYGMLVTGMLGRRMVVGLVNGNGVGSVVVGGWWLGCW